MEGTLSNSEIEVKSTTKACLKGWERGMTDKKDKNHFITKLIIKF